MAGLEGGCVRCGLSKRTLSLRPKADQGVVCRGARADRRGPGACARSNAVPGGTARRCWAGTARREDLNRPDFTVQRGSAVFRARRAPTERRRAELSAWRAGGYLRAGVARRECAWHRGAALLDDPTATGARLARYAGRRLGFDARWRRTAGLAARPKSASTAVGRLATIYGGRAQSAGVRLASSPSCDPTGNDQSARI